MQSLLENYLFIFSCNWTLHSIMSSKYVPLFPLLLGRSLSRMKLITPYASKCSIYQATEQHPSSFSSTSDHDILKENPFYKKYAAKIETLKFSNPKEYEKRMKLLESLHSEPQNDSKSSDKVEATEDDIPPTISNQNKEPSKIVKNLDSIVNLERVQNLTSEEIRSLWIEHYANKDAVCAVIPSSKYRTIYSVANQYPVFVYPAPRQDGYEMVVGQFADDEFHFTSLLNYQRHGADAPSQLNLKHYTELEESKGLVLMSGPVYDEGVSVTDAQLLSYLVQHFHVEHPGLVRDFNRSPETFRFEDVISAMDDTLLMKAGNSKVN